MMRQAQVLIGPTPHVIASRRAGVTRQCEAGMFIIDSGLLRRARNGRLITSTSALARKFRRITGRGIALELQPDIGVGVLPDITAVCVNRRRASVRLRGGIGEDAPEGKLRWAVDA